MSITIAISHYKYVSQKDYTIEIGSKNYIRIMKTLEAFGI